jgi:hypothetical protein
VPEQPRSEPEIIPPGEREDFAPSSRVWIRINGERGGYRAYIARPGPFSIILALLVIGLVAAVVLVFLLGVVLIWIPVAIVLIAAAVLSGSIRRFWQGWRGG